MLNRGLNSEIFAEANRLPILARGRNIDNSVSDTTHRCSLNILIAWDRKHPETRVHLTAFLLDF